MPSDTTPSFVIESVDASALYALYTLAESALPLDRFSHKLLTEKLFFNPQPEQYRFRVFAARVEGAVLGFMQCVIDASAKRGWVGLFAVHKDMRRHGIASALLERVLDEQRGAGVQQTEALAIPCNYFTPGLDPRYTAALAFLERRGFERCGDCVNLLADLSVAFETATDETRLAGEGVTVRRATTADNTLLDAFFATEFGPGWRAEAQLSMANDPPGLHLALRGERIIAFSGHSSQNREWGFFGPMGTLPETRGLGLGRVLLRRCLNDLRDAGHQTAVIPWVGPIAFYAHHAGCEVERVFWRYRITFEQ